jgi:methyl-accepting chemotaxis protein
MQMSTFSRFFLAMRRFRIGSLGLRYAFAVRIVCFALVMAVAAAIGLGAMSKAQSSLHDMYANELSTASVVGRMMNYYEASTIEVKESVQSKLPSRVETALTNLGTNQSLVERMWKEYLAVSGGVPAGDEMQQFVLHKQSLDKQIGKIIVSLKAEHYDDAQETQDDLLVPVYQSLQSDSADLLAKVSLAGQARYETLKAGVDHARWWFLSTLGAGLIVALMLDMWLLRRVLAGLLAASRLAHDIAEGRLGHRVAVSTNDELGQLSRALAGMDGKLCAIVGEMGDGADTVRTASARIAAGSGELAKRTQVQAAALEESAAQLTQLGAAVREHADRAKAADGEARSVHQRAEYGSEVLTRTMAAMREMHADSARVAEIVGIIEGIAFQTNLLALNAAVEAARAGEHGRGFAVVAAEVRILSQRCSVSAKEIKALVAESSERAQAGTRLATDSSAVLNEIVGGVSKVAGQLDAMARGSREQSVAIEQINAAFGEMNGITHKNADLVDDMAVACRSLLGQADALGARVGFFAIADGGSGEDGGVDGQAARPHVAPEWREEPSLAA